MTRAHAEDGRLLQQALARLEGLRRFGVRLGLARVERALEALGVPQRRYSSVHVAGTNGKGSVSATIAACLGHVGHRVGLFTSPHLQRFSERVVVAGEEICPGILADLIERVMSIDPELTFFEVATLVSMIHFAEQRVHWGVFETGLGGRLDATNTLSPAVVVLTSIGLDHTEILGADLPSIAAEKAGIIKPGVPVVAAIGDPAADAVITSHCRALGAPLRWVGEGRGFCPAGDGGHFVYEGPRWRGVLRAALIGPHQQLNAALAVAALEVLAGAGAIADPGLEAVGRALSAVRWPGRLEWITATGASGAAARFLLDCAHNPDGAAALGAALDRGVAGAEGPLCLVFGHLRDKPPESLLAPLLSRCQRVIVTRIANARSADPEIIAARLRPDHQVDVAASAEEALALALADPRAKLVTGSVYLVGELRALLAGEAVDPLSLADPLESWR